MSNDPEKEKRRLAQSEFIEWINRPFSPSDMMTVYLDKDHAGSDIGLYCALIPNVAIEDSLKEMTWDLSLGGGMPGAVKHYTNGVEEVKYYRFGDDDGVEPLVIYRSFHDMRESYFEISEEFRLFHQLYYDRKQDKYVKIDDAGNEHIIIVMEPERIRIRLQEIKQFLAIKEMHLAIMFDCRENSSLTLQQIGLKEGTADFRNDLLAYTLGYRDLGGMSDVRGFSRLLGKRLFPPYPKENSGFWGFAPDAQKKHVDFIIKFDEQGNEVLNTCDPDLLSNNFGANPGKPNYLTPISFRKEVLDKYYSHPSKYSVEDGYLRCGGLWGMTMDNHHPDRVIAWLGDLGRDLPYEEQLHWRSYNIAFAGGVSKTFYQRQILAEFADSERPEHVFKQQYQQLQDASKEMLGWQLLLPLSSEDTHFFESVRVPAKEEQKDFDDVVLALTKVLVDSLNEKELNKLIPKEELENIKGSIGRLEKVLSIRTVDANEEHIKFIRDIQNLRSSGTAHRKGGNYRKIAEEFGIDSSSLPIVFEGILVKGIKFLKFLDDLVHDGVFSRVG